VGGQGAMRNAYNILSKYLMRLSHLEGTEAQGRIILKCILKKQVVGVDWITLV
jgi:hypothetical protein